MVFRRDARKAAANLKKHGIDFHEAATVLNDTLSTTFPDEEHSSFQSRFATVGMSSRGRILVVVHTEHDNMIRIDSDHQRQARNESRTKVL